MTLSLVQGAQPAIEIVSPIIKDLAAEAHHTELIEAYLETHRLRNHAPETIQQQARFLAGWFAGQSRDSWPVYTWEAMRHGVGRPLILDYARTLRENEVSVQTIRSHLGMLKQYFAHVAAHPYVSVSGRLTRIADLYGPIEIPISEFDMPAHVVDFERLGVPLDPERAYEFLAVLRRFYLQPPSPVRSRNYTMAVLALETGLRAQELLHLEIGKDLFFESHKVQTRFAKGTRGSGKRSRLTLFPPLARDSVAFYLKHFRSGWHNAQRADYLFLSTSGKLLTYNSMHEALGEMVACAHESGFPVASHMSWHWFRRLFATRFIERFPDKLHVLVELLGHIGAGTVHHYIRHSQAWIDKEIQAVLERANVWPSIGD
jgi:site-specific recombinase XerD